MLYGLLRLDLHPPPTLINLFCYRLLPYEITKCRLLHHHIIQYLLPIPFQSGLDWPEATVDRNCRSSLIHRIRVWSSSPYPWLILPAVNTTAFLQLTPSTWLPGGSSNLFLEQGSRSSTRVKPTHPPLFPRPPHAASLHPEDGSGPLRLRETFSLLGEYLYLMRLQ